MPFLARGGTIDLTVPVGQSIAIGSFGAGSAEVYYLSMVGNSPQRHYPKQYVSQTSLVLGPFPGGVGIRLQASWSCDLEYVIGVNPVLTGGGGATSSIAAMLAAFGLFATIAATAWGSETAPPVIQIAGYSQYGLGGASWLKLPNHGPGAYTATRYRTMDADGNWWSLPLGDSVKPEQLGAMGDNTTDDTAPWNVALSGLWQRVIPSAGASYVAGDLQTASGITIDGTGGRDYTAIDAYMLPRFTRKVGCNAVLNVSNQGSFGRAVTLIGVIIDGVDQTCNGISAGSSRLNASRCYIINCNNGLGGAASGGSVYTRVASLDTVIVTSCIVGVRDFIDSRLKNCELASNGTNLKATAGANTNQVIGGRIEFATIGPNVQLDAGGAGQPVSFWRFIGVEMDRGVTCAASLVNANFVSFVGCMFRRAGSAAGGLGARSQIYTDNCLNVTVTDPQTQHGTDDGGGGNDTPLFFWEFNNVNTGCVLTGGNISQGFTSGAMHYNSGLNTTQMPGHRITGCVGVQDYDNTSLINRDTGREFYSCVPAASSVLTPGQNQAFVFTVPALTTFDAQVFTLKAWNRDAGQPTNSGAARFALKFWREGSGTTLDAPTVFAEIVPSSISFTAGSQMTLAASAIATDGSSFTITATNSHATHSIRIWMELTPQ
jgi:hypothetical protein